MLSSLLLRLLRLNGWTVDVRPALAGAGVLVTIARQDFVRRRHGATLDAVAIDLFKEATDSRQLAA